MATAWQGGDNFIKIKRGSNGRHGGVGDGSNKKKYGAAGMKNRARFNPNPTRTNHVGCMILAASKVAKELYAQTARPVKRYVSKAFAL